MINVFHFKIFYDLSIFVCILYISMSVSTQINTHIQHTNTYTHTYIYIYTAVCAHFTKIIFYPYKCEYYLLHMRTDAHLMPFMVAAARESRSAKVVLLCHIFKAERNGIWLIQQVNNWSRCLIIVATSSQNQSAQFYGTYIINELSYESAISHRRLVCTKPLSEPKMVKYTWAWPKWVPFEKRHFQIHFSRISYDNCCI